MSSGDAIERILIVRHGLTDWNVDGRWQGVLPVGLNDAGRAQANSVGRHLANYKIGSIYSSDLPRALDTAIAIGTVHGITPQTDIRLREFNLGIFQGLTRDEIKEHYPQEWHDFEADYWNYIIRGGESRRDLQARAYQFFEQVVTHATGPDVVLVSHGGTIRMLLLKLFEGNPALNHYHVENTSVTTILRENGGWSLLELAAVQHL